MGRSSAKGKGPHKPCSSLIFSLAGIARPQFSVGGAEPTVGVPHWDIRDELPDPLSSFVPELKPRLGGVFLCRKGPSAGVVQARSGAPRAGSRRVAGVDRRRTLQLAFLGHGRGVRLAFLPARAEPCPGDVVLGRAVAFPVLADLGLLADALRHGNVPMQTGAPDPATSYLATIPCAATVGVGQNGDGRDFFTPPCFYSPVFLFYTVPAIDTRQCRVPPSPPAIRDMKKPRQRKSPGLRIQASRPI